MGRPCLARGWRLNQSYISSIKKESGPVRGPIQIVTRTRDLHEKTNRWVAAFFVLPRLLFCFASSVDPLVGSSLQSQNPIRPLQAENIRMRRDLLYGLSCPAAQLAPLSLSLCPPPLIAFRCRKLFRLLAKVMSGALLSRFIDPCFGFFLGLGS